MEFDALPVCQEKWVYSFFALQIPKCASSSIQAAVGERNLIYKHRGLVANRFGKHPLYRGVFDTRHLIPEHMANVFNWQVLEFLSFCVVRHPVERILSSFSFGKAKELWKVYDGLSSNTTLDEYILWLYKNRQRKDILILLPQTTWSHNQIFPVEILRFEKIAEDWKNLLKTAKITGLSCELPWENKSQHNDWREEISGESLKMVLDLTEKDAILYPELYD